MYNRVTTIDLDCNDDNPNDIERSSLLQHHQHQHNALNYGPDEPSTLTTTLTATVPAVITVTCRSKYTLCWIIATITLILLIVKYETTYEYGIWLNCKARAIIPHRHLTWTRTQPPSSSSSSNLTMYQRASFSYRMSARLVAVPTMYWGLNNQVIHLQELMHMAITEGATMCLPHISLEFMTRPGRVHGIERPFGYLFDRAHFQQCTALHFGLVTPISLPDQHLCHYLIDVHHRRLDSPGYNEGHAWPHSAAHEFGDVCQFNRDYHHDYGHIHPPFRYNGDQFRHQWSRGKRVLTASSLLEQFRFDWSGYGDEHMSLYTHGCLRGNPSLMAASQRIRDAIVHDKASLEALRARVLAVNNHDDDDDTVTDTNHDIKKGRRQRHTSSSSSSSSSSFAATVNITVIGLHLRIEMDMTCAPNASYIIEQFCDTWYVPCSSSILIVATGASPQEFMPVLQQRFLRMNTTTMSVIITLITRLRDRCVS
jgi:hypothetical protein